MLFQICLNLLCVWVGFMIAIFVNKYLSRRKEKSIPGYSLIKDVENKKNGWLSEILNYVARPYGLDMGDKAIVSIDKNFTLTAEGTPHFKSLLIRKTEMDRKYESQSEKTGNRDVRGV